MSRNNRDISNAWVVKTVSIFGPMSNGRSRWEDFVSPWIDTENDRPNLRADSEYRLRGTSRLNLDSEGNPYYEGVLTKKTEFFRAHAQRLDPRIKYRYTRHQSVSLINPSLGYYPHVFDNGRNHDALIGIAVPLKDILIQRIMWYDADHPSYARPYDAESPEEAAKNAQLFVDRGVNFLCPEDLQEQAILHHPKRLNELHARLKRLSDIPEACICVFKNNPESRLLAQLCALDLQYRLKEPSPRNIILYDQFVEYTSEEQISFLAESKERYPHYVLAINFLKSSDALIGGRYKGSDVVGAYHLLKRINPVHAQYFLKMFLREPDDFSLLAQRESLTGLLTEALFILDSILIDMMKNAKEDTNWQKFFSSLSVKHIQKAIDFLLTPDALTLKQRSDIAFIALKELLKKKIECLVIQLGWDKMVYVPFITVNKGIPENKKQLSQMQAVFLTGFLKTLIDVSKIEVLKHEINNLIQSIHKVVSAYDQSRFFRFFPIKNKLQFELDLLAGVTNQVQEMMEVAEMAALL